MRRLLPARRARHRTQSTSARQIKRLEDDVGNPCSIRAGKDGRRRSGERLVSYARLLGARRRARDVMARPGSDGR